MAEEATTEQPISTEFITVRDYVPDDRNFILASWLRGLKYGNDLFGAIDATTYYKYYHDILEKLLDKPSTEITIACLKDAPDVILGYSVHRDTTLDWVFVKSRWRGIGVANKLIPNNIKAVSHLTKIGSSILKKRPNVVFNPFE